MLGFLADAFCECDENFKIGKCIKDCTCIKNFVDDLTFPCQRLHQLILMTKKYFFVAVVQLAIQLSNCLSLLVVIFVKYYMKRKLTIPCLSLS